MEEKDPTWADSLRLVGGLGFQVAIPLVLFALGGRWLDTRFDASPLFFMSGVAMSIIISSIVIAVKIRKLIK